MRGQEKMPHYALVLTILLFSVASIASCPQFPPAILPKRISPPSATPMDKDYCAAFKAELTALSINRISSLISQASSSDAGNDVGASLEPLDLEVAAEHTSENIKRRCLLKELASRGDEGRKEIDALLSSDDQSIVERTLDSFHIFPTDAVVLKKIIELANGPSGDARKVWLSATKALGALGGAKESAALINVAENNSRPVEQRVLAIELLSEISDLQKAYYDFLEASSVTDDVPVEVRVAAISALGKNGNNFAVESLFLIAKKNSLDRHIRCPAIASLGEIKSEAAVSRLIALDGLASNQKECRGAMMRSLGLIGGQVALKYLLSQTKLNDKRVIAEIALQKSDIPHGMIKDYIEAYRQSDFPNDSNLLMVIVKSGDPEAISLLIDRINATGNFDRNLFDIGSMAVPALASNLRRAPTLNARISTARTLKLLGGDEADSAVTHFLSDLGCDPGSVNWNWHHIWDN